MSPVELVVTWLVPTVGFALAVQVLLWQVPPVAARSRWQVALHARLREQEVRKACRSMSLWLVAGILLAFTVYWQQPPFSFARSYSGLVVVWFLGIAIWFVKYLDYRLRNIPPDRLHQLPRLLGTTRVTVVVWAALLAASMGLAWTAGVNRDRDWERASEASDELTPLWRRGERLADSLRVDMQTDLRRVEEQLDLLLRSPNTPHELFSEGYGAWRRWFVLDQMVHNLCRHAAAAAERGDWARCRQSLSIALSAMRRIAMLPLPDELTSPAQQAHARLLLASHVVEQEQILLVQLHRIASLSPVHRQSLAEVLRDGERVRLAFTAWMRELERALKEPSPERQAQQVTRLLQRQLPQRLSELERWERSIQQSIRQRERNA
ncbi:MAG: hypothetical protein RMK92_04645 [Armatimonadota bacterium]|nr:hypothetical protein [Armatimonadota bacterium]